MTSNFTCISSSKKKRPVKIWGRHLMDDKVINQALMINDLPFVHAVSLMPDAHFGLGGPVGAVIVTEGAIIPTACGTDLGCGIVALNTGLKRSANPGLDLARLRHAIERGVPRGEANGKNWHQIYQSKERTEELESEYCYLHLNWMMYTDDWDPKSKKYNTFSSLGTLGGGNHFLELSTDEDDNIWITCHSGSRAMGGLIGSRFSRIAEKTMRDYFIDIPKELSYLPTAHPEFNNYLVGIELACEFARINREIMIKQAYRSVYLSFGGEGDGEISDFNFVGTHHNYAAMENHNGQNLLVTRKGAICAREGMQNIIPINMKFGSFVVDGLGNKHSFNSASHGGGRVMSRREAKRNISLEEHRAVMAGVECKIDEALLDESPAAYKDGDEVINAQSDLVRVAHRLVPFLNIKG